MNKQLLGDRLKGLYESRCEGEPERVCSEKIASYIAILLRQRNW